MRYIFNQDMKAEDRRVAMILCLHATVFVPKGMGHMRKDLGVVWLYYSQDSQLPFSRWITALRALRPSVKSKRSSFLRGYNHDLKLQG